MEYAVENALFQWRGGELRLREAGDAGLERAVELVVDELRKRLGSSFVIGELADLYTQSDWALDLAQRHGVGTRSADAVDAAFARYAREASDYAGGRPRETHGRPE
jgi:hypothetical protein